MNQLQKIIAEIKYRTGDTVDQIASNIGYTRPHLTSAIGAGSSTHVKDSLLKFYGKKLKDYWEDEGSVLHEDQPEIKRGESEKGVDGSKIAQLLLINTAMLRVLLRSQAEVLAHQRKIKVSTALAELTKAIRAEISFEFDEL